MLVLLPFNSDNFVFDAVYIDNEVVIIEVNDSSYSAVNPSWTILYEHYLGTYL